MSKFTEIEPDLKDIRKRVTKEGVVEGEVVKEEVQEDTEEDEEGGNVTYGEADKGSYFFLNGV
jgi:hypothetical protein